MHRFATSADYRCFYTEPPYFPRLKAYMDLSFSHFAILTNAIGMFSAPIPRVPPLQFVLRIARANFSSVRFWLYPGIHRCDYYASTWSRKWVPSTFLGTGTTRLWRVHGRYPVGRMSTLLTAKFSNQILYFH